jgi:hypothetical protein
MPATVATAVMRFSKTAVKITKTSRYLLHIAVDSKSWRNVLFPGVQ